MKSIKNLFFLLALCCCAVASAKVYTMKELSQIPGIGITEVNEGVYHVEIDQTRTGTAYYDEDRISVTNKRITILEGNSLKILDGDTIKFGNRASFSVNGDIDADVANGATLTAIPGCESHALGMRMESSNHVLNMNNLTVEYVYLALNCVNQQFTIRNCVFKDLNGEANTPSNVKIYRDADNSVVENCSFTGGYGGAISIAASAHVGVIIRDNLFVQTNSITPGIASLVLTPPGNRTMIVENNRLIGPGAAITTNSSGITVSDFLGISVFTQDAKPIIFRNNYIADFVVGIIIYECAKVRLENNEIVNNNFTFIGEDYGGYGISIKSSEEYPCEVFATGNRIEGNLIGVNVQFNGSKCNFGRTDDPTAPDYNPGQNVFVNNIKDGVPCDMWNDSKYDVYAQGNTWSVPEQTEELIETVVHHKADNPLLGQVFFMPPGQYMSVDQLQVDDENASDGIYYNLMGQPVTNPTHGIYINKGKKVLLP